MNAIHHFLAQYLQYVLFLPGFIGNRLTARKKNRKVSGFLLQITSVTLWIVWAFSVGYYWASIGSWLYAGQYVWGYTEHKYPRVTERISAAVRPLLFWKKEEENDDDGRAGAGLCGVCPLHALASAATGEGEGGLPVRV